MAYTDEQLRTNAEIMQRGEALPVVLEAHGGARTVGELRLYKLSPAEAAARARKFLFTFLAIAVVSVVCPPHIPWPILCTTIALVGYRARKRAPATLLGGRGTCPACGATQILDGGAPEFPLLHFCSECNARSVLERAPSASEAVGPVAQPSNANA